MFLEILLLSFLVSLGGEALEYGKEYIYECHKED